MARPANVRLKEAIFDVCATWTGDKLTASKLAEALAENREFGFTSPISDRQLQRYLNEWRVLDEDQQRQYRGVHWPESFVRGDLDWADAPLVLELMRTLPEGRRPPVRLAVWYCRLSHILPAAPDALTKRSLALGIAQFLPSTVAFADACRAVEAQLLGWSPPPAPKPRHSEVAWSTLTGFIEQLAKLEATTDGTSN